MRAERPFWGLWRGDGTPTVLQRRRLQRIAETRAQSPCGRQFSLCQPGVAVLRYFGTIPPTAVLGSSPLGQILSIGTLTG